MNTICELDKNHIDYYLSVLDKISIDFNLLERESQKQFLKIKLASVLFWLDEDDSKGMFTDIYPQIHKRFHGELNKDIMHYLVISGMFNENLSMLEEWGIERFMKKNIDGLIRECVEFNDVDLILKALFYLRHANIELANLYARAHEEIVLNGCVNNDLFLHVKKLRNVMHHPDQIITLPWIMGCSAYHLGYHYEDYFSEGKRLYDDINSRNMPWYIPAIVKCVNYAKYESIESYVNDYFVSLQMRDPLILSDLFLLWSLEEMCQELNESLRPKYDQLIELVSTAELPDYSPDNNASEWDLGMFDSIQGHIAALYLIGGKYDEMNDIIEEKWNIETFSMRKKCMYYYGYNHDFSLIKENVDRWYNQYNQYQNDNGYYDYLHELISCIKNAMLGEMGVKRKVYRKD